MGGHVFIVKLTAKSTGLIYFDKKAALEEFLKSGELKVPDSEGIALTPKKAESREKSKETDDDAKDQGDEEEEEEEVEEEEEEADIRKKGTMMKMMSTSWWKRRKRK